MRIRSVLAATALITACSSDPTPESEGPVATPELHTPRWAFEPWISKDISDGPDTRSFLDGFTSRDIPVGVVVIDSPWETDYNTFVPNESRYPDMKGMIAELRARGVRTVLWCTQMLNEDSFDVEEGGDVYDAPSVEYLKAERNNWFVNEGETYFWWKGTGAGIDFFDEEAMAFWHGLQDDLLEAGLAGWKLDFGESYIETDTVITDKGVISHQAYSEEYYRDFWAYGVHKTSPDEFLTMVRPYDKSYHFEGRFFARPEHTPVGWVGDNRRDFVGLIDALDHLFRSAQAGYVVIGSDIGGYLDRDDQDLTSLIPYDSEAFLRWIAMGAMTPFMQLHGRANLEPWNVSERVELTISTYRYWANLHHQMVPFFYSLAENAYDNGDTIMHPIGETEAEWENDWRFTVGEAFLVAPIIDETGVRDVMLPPGRWYDWWDPDGDALQGMQAAVDVGTSARIPLYVAEGAIVPLTVSSTITEIGDERLHGGLTVLVYPGSQASAFVLRDTDDGKTEIAVDGNDITISRTLASTVFVVRTEEPSAVAVGGSASSEHWYDAATKRLYVPVPAADAPTTVTLTL